MAIDSTVDAVKWARLLRRAHELSLSSGSSPSILRRVVAESWRRAAKAGVDPEGRAPKMLDSSETAQALGDHPVSSLLPLLAEMFAEATADGRYFAAFSDADGVLLWSTGTPASLKIAVRPGFLPGHLCSEAAVGTNAVGTALELEHPVQIFSAEHFNRRLHGWTCSAAPIHDPETCRLLAVLDISGDFRSVHPHSLSLVTAVARAVEGELAQQIARRNERLKTRYLERIARGVKGRSALVSATGRVLAASSHGWLGRHVDAPAGNGLITLPGGREATAEPVGEGARILWEARARRRRRPKLLVEALGRERVRVRLRGEPTDLSRRHGEIVVLLALNPEGLSGEALGSRLYGAGWTPVTLRAEVSRLRRLLGAAIDRSPYRLDADVSADFMDVERLLKRGEVPAALDRYAGPLLPSSQAAAIAAARRRIDNQVRSYVLAERDAAALSAWACSPHGRDDLRAHELLLEVLEPPDPRRELIASRLRTLRGSG